MITKDTLLFGSFSKKAGNVGCMFFNRYFQHYKIDAIYKSFSVDSIEAAVQAAKTLRFSGFAVSMPYKAEIIQYLDEKDVVVDALRACNTVLIKEGKLYGYNTDYLAVRDYLKEYHPTIKHLYILGNGAYAKTVQYCCKELDISFESIQRDSWEKISTLRDSFIFNCTPVENIEIHPSNIFIDCINTSETGSVLAKKQATVQFKLYTGIEIDVFI